MLAYYSYYFYFCFFRKHIQYALEPSTSEPLGIAIQGNEIFVAARGGALLARAVDGRTSQRNVQQFGLSEGAEPTSIVIDNTGTVWATDPARNVIMRWQAPYFLNTWLPVPIND